MPGPLSNAAETVHRHLTSDDDDVDQEIPEAAIGAQPGNFVRHVLALGATKTGDGLADAKLVLSWLLGALGAPPFLVGFLVPIREAGALFPQLATAGILHALPVRKWVWVGGSLVQGACIFAMGLAAFGLRGAAAGWTIVALLTVMALARSVCSVTYKDVLGKTIVKSTRGTATGTASTLASVLVFAFGAALATGVLGIEVATIAAALCLAGGLFVFAALVFATLDEKPGSTHGGGDPLAVAIEHVALLGRDAQLRRFIAVRGLLIATALAPPFLLALAGRNGEAVLGELGLFVVASSIAAMCSTYVWGRLSDLSSRRVLLFSALVATLALGAACAIGLFAREWLQRDAVPPLLLFVLMIAYQGVRLGRATHIVDMADPKTRAAYTALSNTAIGLLLALGGAFGFVAQAWGEAVLLGIFAAMCGLAALIAVGLDEVQAN